MKIPWREPISSDTENKILQLITNPCNKTLLDFGAGYGRYLDMFLKYFEKKNLYGIEIDNDCIRILKTKGYNVSQALYDDPVLPFDNEYFDYIFSSNVLEHIPYNSYRIYLNEFYRILKSSGRLLIGAPNYPIKRIYDIMMAYQTRNYKYYLFDDPTHVNKLSILKYEKDLKTLFSQVNLEPTFILFENKIAFIRNHRHKLRLFGQKFFGYCDK